MVEGARVGGGGDGDWGVGYAGFKIDTREEGKWERYRDKVVSAAVIETVKYYSGGWLTASVSRSPLISGTHLSLSGNVIISDTETPLIRSTD